MNRNELRRELARLTAEFKGEITQCPPPKARRVGLTARANSPKRRSENRWDLQYEKPVAQG